MPAGRSTSPLTIQPWLEGSPDTIPISTVASGLRVELGKVLGLLLLSTAALIVHGYHPAAEDAEIYNPAILKMLNPSLYPFGAEFFSSHARLSLYSSLMGVTCRIFNSSLDFTLLFWHFISIFLLLLACWGVSTELFESPRARWAGVVLVAAVLTIPVAGTALYLMDQYANPRELALFAGVFAISAVLKKQYAGVVLWITFGALMHPLMSVFSLSLIAVITWPRVLQRVASLPKYVAQATWLLPLGLSFAYPSQAYRDVVQNRYYFFILRWRWFEWLGILAPLFMLWWFSRLARKCGITRVDLLCRALVVYELIYFALAFLMTIPTRLVALARYQPMRSLQILYVLFFLIMGGLVGQFALQNRPWRWLVLFVPLSGSMFYAQRQVFPSSPHIEWPGAVPTNDWLRSFVWIRMNTPVDAVFALNPKYMGLPSEDEHGFRAVAERSRLADAIKDVGAATMFPDLPLAEHLRQQLKSQEGWERFRTSDFIRLYREWGVTWFVLDQPRATTLECPYKNKTVRVCRLPLEQTRKYLSARASWPTRLRLSSDTPGPPAERNGRLRTSHVQGL